MLDTKVQLTQATTMQSPKLYLCGFPKSGIHLANRMCFGLYEQFDSSKNWIGTNAWTVKRANLELLAKNFIYLKPGQFLKGHIGHLDAIELMFMTLDIGVVFIYRDLRDVVVSQMFHVLSNEIGEDGKTERFQHKGKAAYQAMDSEEEVMLAIINGIDGYPGVVERFETYAPWLDSQWAMSLSYEVMRRNPLMAATKFFDYSHDLASGKEGFININSEVRKFAIQGIITEMAYKPSSAPTFRKGIVGGWKNHFTPKVKQAFMDTGGGDWLKKLSYEQDDTWQ